MIKVGVARLDPEYLRDAELLIHSLLADQGLTVIETLEEWDPLRGVRVTSIFMSGDSLPDECALPARLTRPEILAAARTIRTTIETRSSSIRISL